MESGPPAGRRRRRRADWWNAISPAYRWMMGEVNDRNDEHCGLSLSGSASERL
ncbi:hypothetical protein [Bifidobacterium longum]|uniref:hypothetical protein n=1 Tax=Bifidobacterium longum TaxID=216816 RepID=UPI0015D667E9|nr:hypothetical protein [Bifidobacterium longum]